MFGVSLNGANEAPPNASLGTGTSQIIFDNVAHTLQVDVDFSGLTGNVTQAHIHAATATAGAGTAGVATQLPLFTGFPTGGTAGTYSRLFDLTDATSFNAAYVTANGGTLASAEAALLQAALDGKAYLNIHSSFVAAGEIRGFLQAVPEPSSFILIGGVIAGMAFRRRRTA